MRNSKVKQMICSVEIYRRNGCLPAKYQFTYKDGEFGYWVHLKTGWFFRAVYLGCVSVTADQLTKGRFES
ncbi:hypothetical protein J4N45_10475 [Vibrio sp. SCSIO 43140]|uniref:hypothetical protein n=1 Tax=Vibrio sp. SCSIO 43140 TaxID=2819100 RepID=UPI002074F4AF|nr:hypothetical protein [Vibrio sp. SCSIO 43140]USD58955.1 hypothetical protein J4N45_10475 [Vibrio sp. SCSIO 43140]